MFNYVIKDNVGTSLPAPICRALFVQLLDMLDVLEGRNYMHGDIKLENILVEGGMLKLIDYGSVRKRDNVDEEEATSTMFNHATPQYRHPFFSPIEKVLKYHRSVKDICRVAL